MTRCSRTSVTILVLAAAGLAAAGAASAQTMTLSDAQTFYPQYVMQQQNPQAFQTPCIDAAGTMTIVADVSDISGDALAIGMICQAIGYPAYMAGGTVSFDVPGAFLISHSTVPGFPDAFALDFGVPLGTGVITITITNTGWPEGCIDPGIFLDFAGFDAQSVSGEAISWGALKALY